MKDQILKAGAATAIALLMAACGGNPAKEAPLKDTLELNYTQTTIYQGRTMNKDIHIKIEKADGGMFKASKTTTDENGPYTDVLMLDGFFRYNEVMPYLAGGNDLWLDPAKLATGLIGRLKVEESTYNGKEVYAAIWSEHNTSYHDKTTGLLEGSVMHLKDGGSETVTRVN